MDKSEKLAWAMLTKQEKDSLYLTINEGLSSWEAGEILKLSHYKYLELKERSEKFLKLFVEYFRSEGIESLFSPQTVIDQRFKDYIEACLEKRMERKNAITYSGDASLVVPVVSRTFILKNMERLKESENEWDMRTYRLIMEFDRWNNWRILPRAIQQPSAYKRRNNKRDKVYINYLNRVPKYKIEALMDIYWYLPRKKTKPVYYIALISRELFEDGYKVIPIKTDDTTLNRLSKLCIYIFKDEERADIFGFKVTQYFEGNIKPSQGQRHWQEYRELLESSVNYKQVNNIEFYVDRLDMAYSEFTNQKPRKKNPSYGAKRLTFND